MAKNKSLDYFDTGYEYLDIIEVPLKFSLTSPKILKETVRLVKKANKIMDLGCGLGGTLKIFRSLNPKARLVGVDFSQVALKRAAKQMPGDSRIDFINCDLSKDFPKKIAGVDLVYTSQLLEHIDKPVKFLKEVWGCLRPGGSVVISTVYKKPWARYIYRNRHNESVLAPDHVNEYRDWKELVEQLEKVGFKVKTCEWVNFRFPIIDPLLKLVDKYVASLKLFRFLNSGLVMFLRYYLVVPIFGFYNLQVVAVKPKTGKKS